MSIKAKIVEVRGDKARLESLSKVPTHLRSLWVRRDNFRVPNLNEVQIGSVVRVQRENQPHGEFFVDWIYK